MCGYECGAIKSEWMNANRLSLNVDKTSFMLFTHIAVNREEVEIDIGGRVVQQVRIPPLIFQGILMDDILSFNQHTIALRKNFPVVWVLCIRCQDMCQDMF